MVQITNFDSKTFLIHALELKLWLFEVRIGNHSLSVFAHKFYGCMGYVDDPLPNILYCAIWMPVCIVHPARLCGGFLSA